MTYIRLTSNSPRLSVYFRRMARQLPGTLDEAVHQSAVEAQQLFEKTTQTWRHQPTFELSHEGTGRWGVRTDDPIYRYVDRGTVPHIIRARNVAYLKFTVPFTSKTKPRYIASFQGSRGNQWVRKKQIHHPGIKAREFSTIIKQRAQAPTANRLRAALRQATYGPGAGL